MTTDKKPTLEEDIMMDTKYCWKCCLPFQVAKFVPCYRCPYCGEMEDK